MDKIKDIISAWKSLRLVLKYPAMLILVEAIFKFLKETSENKVPMLTQIAFINPQASVPIHYPGISLWAGIGDANPIERCRHLKAQNAELKRLLRIAKEKGDLSELDQTMIDLALDFK